MIDGVQGISGHGIIAGASAQGAGLQSLSDQFNGLMDKNPDPSIYTEQHLQETGSPVTAFMMTQEQYLRQTVSEVQNFGKEAPMLGVHELAARQIELSYQVAMVQVQFNAGISVAQSGKSGLQTLMKNQ